MPQRYWDLYRDEDIDLPGPPVPLAALDPHSRRLRHVCAMDAEPVTEAQVRNAHHAYFGAISYVDDNLGRLMAALKASGLAEDTIVILLSDHGEMLGERGLWYKMSFFEGASRVPLVVASPGRFAPRRIRASVSLLDILPTLVDLAGGDAGGARVVGRRAEPRRPSRRTRGPRRGDRRISRRRGDRANRDDPSRRVQVHPFAGRPRPAL